MKGDKSDTTKWQISNIVKMKSMNCQKQCLKGGKERSKKENLIEKEIVGRPEGTLDENVYSGKEKDVYYHWYKIDQILAPDGLPGPIPGENPCSSAVIIPDASTSTSCALMFTHLPCIKPSAITLKFSCNNTLTVGELVTVSAAVSFAPFMIVSEFKLIVFLLKPSV